MIPQSETIPKGDDLAGPYPEDLSALLTAGLDEPDISILSDEFLVEVRDMPQRNLAFEMLKKLLNDEIRIRMRKNIVQQRSFLQLLENAIKAYTNKSIEAA